MLKVSYVADFRKAFRKKTITLHQINDLTLFIADIALLAPFIPTATEVWADIAYKRTYLVILVTSHSRMY